MHTGLNYPSDHGVVTLGEKTSTDRQDRFNDWTREFYLDGEKAGTVTQVSQRLFGLDRHEPSFYRVNFLTGHNSDFFHVDDYDGSGFLTRKAANLFVHETLSAGAVR
jgi:hypothetical protein|tara:strand:+ start:651 stop:971 length:321 start_codon:yes stop_codon:yes gene_type:complete